MTPIIHMAFGEPFPIWESANQRVFTVRKAEQTVSTSDNGCSEKCETSNLSVGKIAEELLAIRGERCDRCIATGILSTSRPSYNQIALRIFQQAFVEFHAHLRAFQIGHRASQPFHRLSQAFLLDIGPVSLGGV